MDIDQGKPGVKFTKHQSGIEIESIKIAEAKLWFMSGLEYNRLSGVLKEGVFSVYEIIQYQSHAVLTKCMVENIEWPLTRDSTVLRVGKVSFAFSMPGLLYGLQLSQNCSREILDELERLFRMFTCYQDFWRGELGNLTCVFLYYYI